MVAAADRGLVNGALVPRVRITRRAMMQRSRRFRGIRELTARLGDKVGPDDVLGWGQVPGMPLVLSVATQLSCESLDVPTYMVKQVGARVRADEPIATRKTMFGLGRKNCVSPIDGTIVLGPTMNGEVVICPDPWRAELVSHLHGRVVAISETEGAVIEAVASCLQGVVGLGGEAHGPVRLLTEKPGEEISPKSIQESCAGSVIAGGHIGREALNRAEALGVAGIVVGSVTSDTYHEAARMHRCPSIVITDGFGPPTMSDAAFEVLRSSVGEVAAVFPGSSQGQTTLPEVIISVPWEQGFTSDEDYGLELGSVARVITGPNSGATGVVVELPGDPCRLESGLLAPVLTIELVDGSQVTVAISNIEIIG